MGKKVPHTKPPGNFVKEDENSVESFALFLNKLEELEINIERLRKANG